MRDNDQAAASLGKNVAQLRLLAFAVGGAMAGLEREACWSSSSARGRRAVGCIRRPSCSSPAIIIGGTGNDLGAIIGVILVPIGFAEATRYIPAIGKAGLVDALQWIAIGLLFLRFLWFRPQGIFPERKRRYLADGRPATLWTGWRVKRQRGLGDAAGEFEGGKVT